DGGPCADQSTCGRPRALTCCRTDAHGHTKCCIKPRDAACRAPKGGSACIGTAASCCDACSSGTCAPPETTTTTLAQPPTTTTTAEATTTTTAQPTTSTTTTTVPATTTTPAPTNNTTAAATTTTTPPPPTTTPTPTTHTAHDHGFRTPAHDDDRGADHHHDSRSAHDHHDLDHVDHVDHDDHHAADVRVHRPGPTDRGGVPANGRRGPEDLRHGLHESVPRVHPGLGQRLPPGPYPPP